MTPRVQKVNAPLRGPIDGTPAPVTERELGLRERRSRHLASISVPRVLELLGAVEDLLDLEPAEKSKDKKWLAAVRQLRVDFVPFEMKRGVV